MFLLDTDVLSALMKAETPPEILEWVERREQSGIFLGAITRAEIEYGISRLPDGKKKTALAAAAETIFRVYAGQCLPFDEDSARYFAAAKNVREKTGRRATDADMMIAAIAMQNRLTLATRNIRHFSGIGDLKIVNPWR